MPREPTKEEVHGSYAGKTPREIAAGLNADGIKPPRGKNWNASTINGNAARGHGMLINELYAGRIVWNKVRMIKESCDRKARATPEPQRPISQRRRAALGDR